MQEDVEVLEGDIGSVLDPDGELDTYIYVASIKLNPNEKLDLEIVYTSYKGTSQIQVKLSYSTGNNKMSENAIQGCTSSN
jgi:hypothetical protein